MIEKTVRETARIYQFSIRDRATKVGHREGHKRIAERAPAGVASAEFGSGWYHEAAVQEAEQARNRWPR